MNDRIRLLVAVVLATGGLVLTLGLLGGTSHTSMPVNAQNLPSTQDSPCSFTAITVTADLNTAFRIYDTLPGGATNRIIYFANRQPGIIAISVTVSDVCHVWGGAAFSRTEPVSFELGGTNQFWLTYPVDDSHGSTNVVLTSSLYITGSTQMPYHKVVLTFIQDVRPPYGVVITTPLHSIDASFPLSWSGSDATSGVAFYTIIYSGTHYTSWQIWQHTQARSGTFTAPITDTDYVFHALAYDYVGNWAVSDEKRMYVGHYRAYLPVALRTYPARPVGSVDIEGEATNVNQRTVTLVLSATVKWDEVAEMRLHNENTEWTQNDWESFSPTKTWTLAGGVSGLRTVYAQFRGRHGGISDPVSDQIYLSRNGSFEDGYNQTAWQGVEEPLPVSLVQNIPEGPSSFTPPADGSYALLLGDPSYPCIYSGVPIGYAAVEQTFNLPSSADTLIFKYIIWSQDASLGETYDRFEVYVNGDLKFYDGNQVNELSCEDWWRIPGPDNPRGLQGEQTSGWAEGQIDLRAYAGQDVLIAFRNYNRIDHWYNTYTYIDDVSVEGDW